MTASFRPVRSLAVFACAAVGLLIPPSAVAAPAPGVDCSIAKDAVDIASRLRGLKVLRQVPCKLQDRRQVESYLRHTLQKKIPEERVRHEGEVYRLLGLVPVDYDYVNGLIGMYTDQLGGYYEPEDEYYAMAAWIPEAMQMPIAVHELTHALQDQHFNLDKAIDHENELGDTLMARSALIEGDATAVMLDYARELSGQPSIAREESVSTFMLQNITGAMISSSLHKAPPALQAMLIFPYVSGLNFAHAILKRGGFDEIDRSFKRYPRSTEEILHPDKYLRDEPDFIEVPEPAGSNGEKAIFSDRIGEFAIATMLGSWIPPLRASNAAAGWGGDRVALFDRGEGRYAVVWHLHWDTDADAEEFISALSTAYETRFSHPANKGEGIWRFERTPFGPAVIRRQGKGVQVEIGFGAAGVQAAE